MAFLWPNAAVQWPGIQRSGFAWASWYATAKSKEADGWQPVKHFL